MISRPSIAVIAAFLLIGTAGCTASPAKPTESEMTAPADANAPDEVRGIAENAKGGAVIIAESGEVVYLAGVDEWPAELRGKKVVARGTLEETDYIPGPAVADDGAISAGSSGREWVLREPTWVVDE